MPSVSETKIQECIVAIDNKDKECRSMYYNAIDSEDINEAIKIQQEMTHSVWQLKRWKDELEELLAEIRASSIL
ncbi:MAG: hypothetical protein FWG30_09545 [Eubacteriaceae bacterium]|nr:hypothetical protein [Eubacteriaceae bacterium]